MAVQRGVANDPWLLDDWWRRTVMQLFNDQLPQQRQNRNRQYREGLLTLIEGLTHENPFDIKEGIAQIEAVFDAGIKGRNVSEPRVQTVGRAFGSFPSEKAMGGEASPVRSGDDE